MKKLFLLAVSLTLFSCDTAIVDPQINNGFVKILQSDNQKDDIYTIRLWGEFSILQEPQITINITDEHGKQLTNPIYIDLNEDHINPSDFELDEEFFIIDSNVRPIIVEIINSSNPARDTNIYIDYPEFSLINGKLLKYGRNRGWLELGENVQILLEE